MSGPGQVATTDLVPPVIAAPELEPGARLGERYRLIARLGRGGGGTVWRVFDDKVGEELALKLIDGGTDLERWRREVALARRISHANVCRVYDLGEARGLRWVTMERIEGHSLRALLQRGAVAEPARVMQQLVDGVAAIHAAGVVHRDLKPENVVVDGDGRAVIVDFGLARRPLAGEPGGLAEGSIEHPGGGDRGDGDGDGGGGQLTGPGAVMGTPRYMAPEQAAGAVVDARADVYALGLVLCEIVGGGGAGAMASTVAGGDAATEAQPGSRPAGPGRVRRSARRGPWRQVIERCTAWHAADRYPDAVAVRAALVAPRRRQRRLVLGAAAAVAVVVAGLAVIAGPAGDATPQAKPLTQRRLTATAAVPASQPSSIALSRDGATLGHAVATAVMVRAIDGGRDQAVTMPTTPGGLELARAVEAVGFLGDGRVVALILDRDHAWALWALAAGRPAELLYRAARAEERMIAALAPGRDQLAVATPSLGLVTVALGGGAGAGRTLVAPEPGERLAGVAWSPDGARVAFVRQLAGEPLASLETVSAVEPGDRQVIARPRLVDPVDQMTAWPAADRVVYVVNEPEGAALIAVPVTGDGAGAPAAIVHWPAEYVAQLAAAPGRIAVLRGTAERTIATGTIDRRGYFLNLQRAPGPGQVGRLAGWTADGRLVHGADADVVVRAPSGPASALAAGSPEAVAGDTVVYRRAAALRTVGLAGGRPDAAIAALDPRAVAGRCGDLVRCAGDRAPPCVIAIADRAGVRFLRFDPATGAAGGELYRAPLGPRFCHAMAVSPDGATLAVVDGTSAVTLIALAGGHGEPGRELLARSAELVGVSWSRDGASLLVSLLDGGEDRASVVRIVPGGGRQLLLHSDQRRYGRVHEDPQGDGVAIESRELALDAWLIEGL